MSDVNITLKYRVANEHGLKDEDLEDYDRLVGLSHDKTSVEEFTRLLKQASPETFAAFNDYRKRWHAAFVREEV